MSVSGENFPRMHIKNENINMWKQIMRANSNDHETLIIFKENLSFLLEIKNYMNEGEFCWAQLNIYINY